MRGTPAACSVACVRVGIIPAYAGNTSAQTLLLSILRDHPRVCGEHSLNQSLAIGQNGSSPRMRGTHCNHCNILRLAGIIPAYAGNTNAIVRMCGTGTGSSPRMRGTHVGCCNMPAFQGIIPAYAGNTAVKQTPLGGGRDHPRVCGEHFETRFHCFTNVGSSPRMRGTHHPGVGGQAHPGIIPAYAGNTLRD